MMTANDKPLIIVYDSGPYLTVDELAYGLSAKLRNKGLLKPGVASIVTYVQVEITKHIRELAGVSHDY